MKKICFLVGFIIFISAGMNAQQDISWQQSFGGSSTDIGNSIYGTADGGYIAAGTVKSIDVDITDHKTNDTLTSDVWLVKTNASGVVEWKKSYGGTDDEYSRCVLQTPDGGFLFGGITRSGDGDLASAGYHGENDMMVMKTNSSGDIVWIKCYGGSGYEGIDNIIPTSDGNYLLLGKTYNSGTSGDLSGIGSNGWTDCFVLKIDNLGNILWKQGYGGNLDDHAQDAIQTSDGGYILACEVESYAGSGDVTQNIGNNHTYDLWLIKIDAVGNIEWKSNFGGTNSEWSKGIVSLADGTYVIAGFTTSNNYDASDSHGDRDGFVVKMDANGNKIWTKSYGGSGFDEFNDLQLLQDNTVLLAGSTNSIDGDVSGKHAGNDGWLVNIDIDGNIIWQKCFGSDSDDGLHDIDSLTNGSIICTGYASANNGDVSENNGKADVWVFGSGELMNISDQIIVNDTSGIESSAIEIAVSANGMDPTDNIIAYQFDIDFDQTVLQYSGADVTGTLAEGGSVTVNSSVDGKLSVSYMNSSALVGTGDILLLQFNTLKADTTTVSIFNAYLNTTEVTDLAAGTVIVKDVTPPTAAISYDDTENRCGDELLITATFDEPILEANAMKIGMTGGAVLSGADMTRVGPTEYTFSYTIPNSDGNVNVGLSNGTDLWGNEITATPTSGTTFSITPINYGDVDDDGKIMAYDAALTLQYSIGLDPLPSIDPLPWENWRDTTANVDGVGAVTANDAGMILQYSAGIITSFDASVKKSVSQAFISIQVVNNEIVFYSYGDLVGLNINAKDEDQVLGTPEIIAENFMSASNISGSTYKIGLCTTQPPKEGDAVMKIPFTQSGEITFDMNVNTHQQTLTLNLNFLTGFEEVSDDGITIYPNPVNHALKIKGLQSNSTGSIFNANGQMLFSREIEANYSELNVSELPDGIYILKLKTEDAIIVKRFMKQ